MIAVNHEPVLGLAVMAVGGFWRWWLVWLRRTDAGTLRLLLRLSGRRGEVSQGSE